MKALTTASCLFANALRSSGFTALAAGAALLHLSLAWLTSFGLGREFAMIREASLGGLFLAGFVASLAAGALSTRQDSLAVVDEGFTRCGSRSAGVHAIVLVSIMAGSWTWLTLVPFALAALAIFHGHTASAMATVGVGIMAPTASAFFSPGPRKTGFALSTAAAGAAVSMLLAFELPDRAAMAGLMIFGLVPLAMACSFSGLLLSLLPGVPGILSSAALLVLCSMRGSLLHDASLVSPLALVPDLYNLAPSMLAATWRTQRPCGYSCALAYAAMVIAAVFLLAASASNLKTEMK